ncbi:MAG TPA: hypothetical protein VGE15_00280, partial [Sphingobacteriaceae bacterium]
MKSLLILLLVIGLFCKETGTRSADSMVLTSESGCDDPDGDVSCCFRNMPADLSAVMLIGGPSEPGEQLTITGTIYHEDGKTPYPGVTVYAYHTDSKGYYSKDGTEKGIQKWHGRLHGWCRSDRYGRYEIRTIRPAPYPNATIPAHIHAAILEPGKAPFYLSDYVFSDDRLVTPAYLASVRGPGGKGVITLGKTSAGWTGKRD